MKKLFVGLVLPILAATAIIGSGFSVWAFSGSDANNPNQSVDVNFDPVAGNDFTAVNLTDLKLSLDQTKAIVTGDTSPKNGARFTTTSLNKMITIQKKAGAASNIAKPTSIKTHITLPNALNDFIKLNNADRTGQESDKLGVFYEYDWTLPTEFSTTLTATWDFAEVTAGYQDGKEPNTQPLYDAMFKAIATSTITIKYLLAYN